MAEERQTDYFFYKGLGICVKCHKYPAEPGKARCEECNVKKAEENRKRFASMSGEEKNHLRTQQYAAIKGLMKRRREMGVCVKCGKATSRYSICLCPDHLVKERRRKRRYAQKKKGYSCTRAELPSYGICYRCCRNPVMEGKKLCTTCYESNLHVLEIARSSKNAEKGREYFRNLDKTAFLESAHQKGAV